MSYGINVPVAINIMPNAISTNHTAPEMYASFVLNTPLDLVRIAQKNKPKSIERKPVVIRSAFPMSFHLLLDSLGRKVG
jgi:hypothetical protein